MEITRNLKNQKNVLLHYFRGRAQEILNDLALQYSPAEYKKKATAINKSLLQSKETLLNSLFLKAQNENWDKTDVLECILMITYTNDIVMLETRNSVWEYEYMTFSRRIGELWEPLCKLCFQYSTTNISLFIPPLFADVKRDLTTEIQTYIKKLRILPKEKEQLKKYYDKVWGLVTSGEIQLECDLHFTDGKTKYIVDFKSGFGSNEKGNTNRLLLVGSIYKNIESENYKCLIFVRATENNHYLNTLQNSNLWQTYCGHDSYTQIQHFTGFDIQTWINQNIDWMQDFSEDMKNTITNKNLQEYLVW